MRISKRVLALAGAGVLALVLGGAAGVFNHGGATYAGAPTNGAIGCAAASANILFPASAAAPLGLITGAQIAQANGSTNATGNGFLNPLAPTTPITCGALFQDSGPCVAAVVGPPAVPSSGNCDGVADTVDGGVISYTVSGPVTILQSNATIYSVNCGSSTPPDAVTAVGPPIVGTDNETCQGAITSTVAPFTVTPNPGNTVQVQLATNTSLGAIGFTNLGTGASISAVYNRFPAISATPATFSAGTAPIAFIQPFYAIVLSVSNGTITAALPSASTAQTANTTSVITASLFRSTTVPCQVITGVSGFVCGNALFGTSTVISGTSPGFTGAQTLYFAPGIEPSVVSFSTSLGLFVGSSQTGGVLATNTSAQTISVQCGNQPATNPLITTPLLGQAFSLGLTSCVSVTATIAGGGAAGTAQIVVSSIGDFTGTTAQQTTEVNLVPGPSTTNLSTGCNEVITPPSLAPGSNSAAVLKLVTGFNVASIWMFNNATHTFQALYFSATGAPTDISAVGPGQSIFVCGTGAGTFQVSP